jgi:hypothetical protein
MERYKITADSHGYWIVAISQDGSTRIAAHFAGKEKALAELRTLRRTAKPAEMRPKRVKKAD